MPSERSSTIISSQIISDKDMDAVSSLWGDSVGRLYMTDTSKHLIRTLNLNDLTAPLVTVAGNGDDTMPENGAVATSTGIGSPSQMWVNVEGHFFFADYEACNVYEVNEEGRIYKILGTGSYGGELRLGSSSGLTQIGSPVGIVGDVLGNLYVAANSGNGVIYKLSERSVKYDYKIEYFGGVKNGFSLQGSYGYWNGDKDGNTDGLSATTTHFTYIASIGIDSQSNIYVEDGGPKIIRKIDDVSGLTQVVVDKEAYNQVDCDYDIDDDNQSILRRMYVDSEGGIFLYSCFSLRYIAPHQLTLQTSRSFSFVASPTNYSMIAFTLVGLSILFFTTYRGIMKFK